MFCNLLFYHVAVFAQSLILCCACLSLFQHQQSQEQNISGSSRYHSDHDLVMMTMKPKPAKFAESRLKTQVQPWKAERPRIADLFEATIGGKVAALNLLEEIHNLTENIHGPHRHCICRTWLSHEEEALDDQRHSESVTEEGASIKEEKNALWQCRTTVKLSK